MNLLIKRITKLPLVLVSMLILNTHLAYAQADPLPSWNDTQSKQAIIAFVENVTSAESKDYVAPAERIATFDNDGTLWGEQPLYFQLFFVFDRINALAPQHPEWKTQEPFASVLKGDHKGALAGGKKALVELAMAALATTPMPSLSKLSRIG